jgi:GT2 family glycosyltransferase
MQASVLIPTRNRRDSLLRTLRALRSQRADGPCFEIIVSFDRCTDGSAEAVSREFPDVRALVPSAPGPSGAFNAAARAATGPLLIFLDDDMDPVPDFVAAHVGAHRNAAGRVAVAGRILPTVVTRSPFSRGFESFYRTFQEQLERGELTRSPYGLPGGNASIKAEDFRSVGGIDERYEFAKWDFELGARLIEQGFRMLYAPDAAATTYLQLDAAEMLARAEMRATSDVRLAREHPWCVRHLELHRAATRTDLRASLLWNAPGVVRRVAAGLRRFAPMQPILARTEMTARYWSELRRQLGSRDALRELSGGAHDGAVMPPNPEPSLR